MSALSQAVRERVREFAGAVIEYRADYHMTESSLAEECEVSVNAIQSLTKGERTPNCSTILKISMATGIAI